MEGLSDVRFLESAEGKAGGRAGRGVAGAGGAKLALAAERSAHANKVAPHLAACFETAHQPVRFTPDIGHRKSRSLCPLVAISGH